MTKIQSYRDLLVWQKSMLLVKEIYQLTQQFPTQEMYGLTIQVRKSAISIPSNIAEGYGRNATGDYKRFLQIATGSLYELQTQIEIALSINYLPAERYNDLFVKTTELDRMLCSLIKKIN